MVPSRIWRLWTVVFFSFGAGRRGRRRRGLRDMMWRDFWTIFENINEIVCSGGRRGLEDLEDFEWLWRTLKQPQFMLALTDWATYQPGLGTLGTPHTAGGRGHGGLTLVSRLPSHSRQPGQGGSMRTSLFSRWVNFSVCCWFKKKKKLSKTFDINTMSLTLCYKRFDYMPAF